MCFRSLHLVSQLVTLLIPTLTAFPDCEATIVAIKRDTGFVDVVNEPDAACGIILDRTIMYAESGGQAEDHGFLVHISNDVSPRLVVIITIKPI